MRVDEKNSKEFKRCPWKSVNAEDISSSCSGKMAFSDATVTKKHGERELQENLYEE